jgi:apolipoprotein N-acyltransferase
MPLPICALVAICSFPFLAIARKTKSVTIRYIMLSSAWSFFEFVKSKYLVGGLPLANIGLIITKWESMIQIGAILTQSQIDTLVTFLAFLPYFYIAGHKNWKIPILIGLLLVSCNIFYGHQRLKEADRINARDMSHFSNMKYRMTGVQGNISNKLISSSSSNTMDRARIFQIYYNFTKKSIFPSQNSILIWPEAAVTYYNAQDDDGLLSDLSRLIPHQGIMLFPSILGSRSPTQKKMLFFNTTTTINNTGELLGRFNKRHLVPFGEYIPLRWLIPSFIQTIASIGDLDHQPEKISFVWLERLAIMPTICYDSFFDDVYVDVHGNKPDIIINMTNTGWIGSSIGFYQHFFASRMRAVRNKTPFLNIANSDGTVFIDEYGRFIKHLPNKEMSAIDLCVFTSNMAFYNDRSKDKLFKFREC